MDNYGCNAIMSSVIHSAAPFEISRVLLIQVNSKYMQITMKGKYSIKFDYGETRYSFFLPKKTLQFQQWDPGGLWFIEEVNRHG